MTELKDAALAYARNGLPVFPLKPGGKTPATGNGLHDATTDPERIEEWWGEADYNIGLPTGRASGIVVIDIDGPDGYETLSGLGLPLTRSVKTGNGEHLYYAYTGEDYIKNGAGERGGLGKGVDVRGDGGYVVAAPSVHPSGGRYVASKKPMSPLPESVIRARAKRKREKPDGSVLDRLKPQAKGAGVQAPPMPLIESDERVGTREGLKKLALEAGLLADEDPDGGMRNARLNEVAFIIGGYVSAGHLDEGYAAEMLFEAADRCGLVDDPDDGPDSVIATMESGMGAGAQEPHPTPGHVADWVRPSEAYTHKKMLYTLTDLATLPPLDFLIDETLPARSLTVVFGPSGSYKSFLVLDWALSIAAGRPWGGHESRRGLVVYVAAEGASGILKRARAWQQANPDADVEERFRVVPRRVSLMDPESVNTLRTALAEELDEEPALVIIDTLARSMPGGDENSATDMGKVVDAVDALRHDHRCSVLLVHHSGRQEGHERGSTALEGGVDARYEMKADREMLRAVLKCHKMKDAGVPDPVELSLEEAGDSLVVRPGVLDEEARKRIVAETIRAHADEHPEGMTHGFLVRRLPMPKGEAERAIKEAELDVSCPVGRHKPAGWLEPLFTLIDDGECEGFAISAPGG